MKECELIRSGLSSLFRFCFVFVGRVFIMISNGYFSKNTEKYEATLSQSAKCRINRVKFRKITKNVGLTVASLSDNTDDPTFFRRSLEMSD